MTLIYIILGLLAALYLVGCYLAYGAVKVDDSMSEEKYSRRQMVKLTLGSWATVVIGLIGRVQ